MQRNKSKRVTSHLFSIQLLLGGFADSVTSQFLKITFQPIDILYTHRRTGKKLFWGILEMTER